MQIALPAICPCSLWTIRSICRVLLILKSFTAVLRYNSSYFYAGAVAELGSAIAEMMGKKGLIDGEKLLPPHLKPQPSSIAGNINGIKETVTPLSAGQ